jgi:hypothetical protein
VAAGVAAGLVVGVSLIVVSAGGDSPTQATVETAFLAAINVQENLGSQAPQGVTDPNWATAGDPYQIENGQLTLSEPGTGWLGSPSTPSSSSNSSTVLAQQTPEIDAYFATGPLQDRLLQALQGDAGTESQINSDVQSSGGPLTGAAQSSVLSQVSGDNLPGPGGADVPTWISVNVSGASATVNAVVRIWNSTEVAAPLTQGGFNESFSVASGYENAYATLVENSQGQWQVSTLDMEPSTSTGNVSGASG